MVNDYNLIPAGSVETASQSKRDDSFLDTRAQFETWLSKLSTDHSGHPGSLPFEFEHDPADFVIECAPGSSCDIQFEGVLHMKGIVAGSIRSKRGTLVTGPGIVDADVEVCTAIISSSGYIDITDTERVLLRGNVRVAGNIQSPALSIREGAIFEGHYLFIDEEWRNSEASQLQVSGAIRGVSGVSAAAE
jgi:cytoskeletal protein CcmA (bactofilin family)